MPSNLQTFNLDVDKFAQCLTRFEELLKNPDISDTALLRMLVQTLLIQLRQNESGGASSGLTDTQLRASAVPVSGGLTDTQLRAAAVPISGTVTANLGTIADVATQTTLALIKAKTDNLDVLLSTRTKPTDTQPTSLASLPALVAGTARIGGAYTISGEQIDEVPSVRSISRSFVTTSTVGNTALVAAQGAGVRIRVLGLFFATAGTVSVQFQSATTNISALFPAFSAGPISFAYNQHGWFQTAANEALNINLDAAISVGCQVTWCPAT